MSASPPLTLRFHLWLEQQEKIFMGMGRAMLLDRIERHGSLRQAAADMKMSYRAAWGKLKAAEESIGGPLVQKTAGRRYQLTPLGREIAHQFLRLQDEIEIFAQAKAQDIFGGEVLFYAQAYPEDETVKR